MITQEQINNEVRSAAITADAWETVIPIYTTVEDMNYGAGGRLFHCRNSDGKMAICGCQPIEQLASVLPYTYGL